MISEKAFDKGIKMYSAEKWVKLMELDFKRDRKKFDEKMRKADAWIADAEKFIAEANELFKKLGV